MTAKEKAAELVGKFYYQGIKWANPPKQIKSALLVMPKICAHIAVDEIIYSYPTDPHGTLQPAGIKPIEYWRDVKNEIDYYE